MGITPNYIESGSNCVGDFPSLMIQACFAPLGKVFRKGGFRFHVPLRDEASSRVRESAGRKKRLRYLIFENGMTASGAHNGLRQPLAADWRVTE